jgi:anti-anti-sigma factor
MQTNTSIKDGKAVVVLTGRFDFNAHRDFRSAYEPFMDSPEARSITIDLRSVEYLDSSALGMLLMLRDKAASAKKDLFLANAQAGVKQVLDIANFGKLFQIV